MKAKINENNEIVIFHQLPSMFRNILNFNVADAAFLQLHGFYDVVEPSFNPDTQILSPIFFDLSSNTFTYHVINLTQTEIQQKQFLSSWLFPEFSTRITIPITDISDNTDLQTLISKLLSWWLLHELKYFSSESFSYFYCNLILPQHIAYINSFSTITIENLT